MNFDETTLDAIRAANSIADVLARDYGREMLPHGNRRKKTLCVFHDETDPSLIMEDNGYRFKCFGCGEHGDVFNIVMKLDGVTFTQAVAKLAQRAGIALPGNNYTAPSQNTKSEVVNRYDYTDESGNVLFQVERTNPKGFRQRRLDGKGGWLYKLDDVRRVLYRLPEVLKATGEVWIVEGEKDCDTLTALGFTATTNSGGAGKWRDEYNEALRNKPVVIVPDNDTPGLKHADTVARALYVIAKTVRVVRLPENVKDVSEFVATFTEKTDAGERLAVLAESAAEWTPTTTEPDAMPSKLATPVLEFLRPSEMRDYQPPERMVLAGDCHIVRGSVFVIGGAPGVGKSRAAVALAVAGATDENWFGLSVSVRFKTMIVQNENGRFRLAKEFGDLDCPALEDFVRVCPPPPLGLAFDRKEFQTALTAAIADFQPDVILIDPWNAVARDDKQRDYLDTFNAIRAVLPTGDTAPALGIVAHTRKPKGDERATGRGLLNLLAGSYVLGSVPRTVFVLQSASDDPTDPRVVWTCCKNNDGELGERTAWERRNGLFETVRDFDWDEFDKPSGDRPTVTEDDLAEVFHHGDRKLTRKQAVAELLEKTGCKQSACYNALKKYAAHLSEDGGLLSWTP